MRFSTIPELSAIFGILKNLSECWHRASYTDLDFSADLEGVSDATWERAQKAARDHMRAGIKDQYAENVDTLKALGIKDIPAISDWPKPEKPL